MGQLLKLFVVKITTFNEIVTKRIKDGFKLCRCSYMFWRISVNFIFDFFRKSLSVIGAVVNRNEDLIMIAALL